MYQLYRLATIISAPLILKKRLKNGKEDKHRIHERKGQPKMQRPLGKLIWMHGASNGEVTSLLSIIKRLQSDYNDLTVLITSGTKTSAKLIADRNLEGVIHQYIPMDHPKWVANFLKHWHPDAAIIAESEIWPNLLTEIKQQDIPAVLINARLSDKSFSNWQKAKKQVSELLSCFSVILTQTETDQQRYQSLGHSNAAYSGNIKFSADKLPVDDETLHSLHRKFQGRPIWVYASTHADEEVLACKMHEELKANLPNLLTVIVPRHPERRGDIAKSCEEAVETPIIFRSAMLLPADDTEIYIVDTLGELGLFYTLADVALIGRTFSNDGGGGHNPIEAAQLDCIPLYGPKYQNLTEIFEDMQNNEAATLVKDQKELYDQLLKIFLDFEYNESRKVAAQNFVLSKESILNNAYATINSILPPSYDHDTPSEGELTS